MQLSYRLRSVSHSSVSYAFPAMRASMAKLSKKIVTAAERAEKDYFLWDDSIPAFAVRV